MKNQVGILNKPRRFANIELLRIVSMMLIISSHLCNHYMDMEGSLWPFPPGFIFLQSIKSITYIAVNMYVLISAYFLCESSFKSKRIVMIWLEVLFYSLIIGIPHIINGGVDPSRIITVFLPILMSEYWFATVFIGLLLLSPFMNMSIHSMNQKALLINCCVLLFLTSIVPTFIEPFSRWVAYGGSCGLLWFITLYYCASYVRLYVSEDFLLSHKRRLLFWGGIMILFAAIARFVIAFTTAHLFGHAVGAGFFYGNNVFFNVVGTMLIFMYFLVLKINNNMFSEIINSLAKSSFAVYLIHENPFIRTYLEQCIPNYYDFASIWFPVQFIFIMMSIWTICTIADYFRRYLFLPLTKRTMLYRFDNYINNMLLKRITA